MKNRILIIFILLNAFYSYCQQIGLLSNSAKKTQLLNSFNFTSGTNLLTKQRLDSVIWVSWNSSSNLWLNNLKYIYVFDTYGKNTTVVNYEWDSYFKKWINEYKMVYSFDNNGKNIGLLEYLWDMNRNEWEVYASVEDSLNSKGKIAKRIVYFWYSTSNLWLQYVKHVFLYDNNDNNIVTLAYEWNITSNEWIINSKKEFQYDNSENYTAYINYKWESKTNEWIPESKGENNYDSFGNKISQIEYVWDYDHWTSTWKEENIYDNNFSSNDILQPIREEKSNHLLVQTTKYQNKLNIWALESKSIRYYSAQSIASTPNLNEVNEVIIFPNPASSFVSFGLNGAIGKIKFELFDLQGKIILRSEIINFVPISISNIPNGVYLYKLINSNKLYTGKLLIK